MDRLIKRWMDVVGAAIPVAMLITFRYYVLINTDYTPSGIVTPNRTFELIIYLLVILIATLSGVIRKKTIKYKLRNYETKILYRPNPIWKRIGVSGIFSGIILFFIAAELELGIVVIVACMIFILSSIFVSDHKVVGAEDWFVINDTKYEHKRISEWRFGDLYRIYCKIDDREEIISCYRRSRYDFMEEYFEKNIKESKASVRDST